MGKDYSDIAFKDDGRLKLLIIVGTRPEVIRLSEVIKKCRRHFDCLLAHTGQNYDYTLNGIFFRDLSLDDPTSTWTPWGPTWARPWATSSPRATSSWSMWSPTRC